MTSYDEILNELKAVPAFQPLTLKSQHVPRLSTLLRPAFHTLAVSWLGPIIHYKDRLTYKSLEISGGEQVPRHPAGPFIFIANHCSYLDPPLLGFTVQSFNGRAPWFMAKKKLWERFNYRFTFSMLGALPYVRRGVDLEEHVMHLKAFTSVLKANQSIFVFPEGTIPGEIEIGSRGFCKLRSDAEPETGLLKTGALVPLLALAAGAKVIPIGLSGTGKVLPPETHPGGIWTKRRSSDHHVKIAFGAPIDVDKEIREFSSEITEESLSRYANQKLMPRIASLIDFELYEPACKPPLSASDYARIQSLEVKIADEYRTKGKLAQAAQILKNLDFKQAPKAKVREAN